MLRLLRLLSTLPVSLVRSRCDLLLENLALRQQLSVLSRRHPQPRFSTPDRFFWMMLRRLWPGWKRALILAQPGTVVRWHRLSSSNGPLSVLRTDRSAEYASACNSWFRN